jgi:hypothetical protein
MGNIGGSAVSLEDITLLDQGLPPLVQPLIKVIIKFRRRPLSPSLMVQLEVGFDVHPIEAHLLEILEITDNKRD